MKTVRGSPPLNSEAAGVKPIESIPLEATLVRGSHGVPVSASKHSGVILSNDSTAFGDRETVRDTDVAGIVLNLLGL